MRGRRGVAHSWGVTVTNPTNIAPCRGLGVNHFSISHKIHVGKNKQIKKPNKIKTMQKRKKKLKNQNNSVKWR
jgi:hypothetical protein